MTGKDRRLVAVLAADVVGYTRLMEQDTEGTVVAWKSARADVIDPTITNHAGRIVKHTGDGFLAEFSTVQSAVECAVTLQGGLADGPLEFRIGVNLGDIIDDGEDIHGEGVNIAARIEALADPGGIMISGGAYDQVRNRLDYHFEDRGEHEVKHVSAPVRVFAVGVPAASSPLVVASDPGVRPAIAVLPFDNMSGDEEQEYFADGMTEDIITELSKFRWLTVIARNSTFVYKGQAIDIPKVAGELNVGYVLEGSLRRSGERVRITAQLIDAASNEHIWAERYDRKLHDIFDLQDEMTQTLVGIIEPELAHHERERGRDKPTENMTAWELLQRGLYHRWRFSPDEIKKAHEYFDQAIGHDAGLAAAYAHRAWTGYVEIMINLTDDRDATVAAGISDALRAIDLNDRDPLGYVAYGFILTVDHRYEEAAQQYHRAIDLNPSFAAAYYGYGMSLLFARLSSRNQENWDPAESMDAADMAIRLSPNDPMLWPFLNLKGMIHFNKGEYQASLEYYQRASQIPNALFWIPFGLAACTWQLGDQQGARDIVAKTLLAFPGVTWATVINFGGAAIENLYGDILIKAGLPEK